MPLPPWAQISSLALMRKNLLFSNGHCSGGGGKLIQGQSKGGSSEGARFPILRWILPYAGFSDIFQEAAGKWDLFTAKKKK